jgi:putative tricarboxylic transport membrane protein
VIGMFLTGQLAKLTLIPYPLIGAIIIPISFLSAFLNATDIIAIYIVVAAALLGLLMKQFRWPRPPLLLGFILGPIIEFNFQSAISVQGAVGMLTRPLTIILMLLAVATAVFFSRMGKIGAPAPDGEHEMTPLAEDFNTGLPALSLARIKRARLPMNASTLFTLGLIGACVWALVTAFDYPTRGRVFPVALSSAVIILALVQLGLDALQVKSGEIMDIGMRSAGMAGIRTTALLVFGLVGAFIVLIFLIGLKYATPLFAIAVPLTLMEGRARWYGALAGFGFVTLFNYVLMDRIMAVIWYEPLIPLFRIGQ